jgi:hypothetical protein
MLRLLHVDDFANHESSGILIFHNSKGFIHGVHDFNGLIQVCSWFLQLCELYDGTMFFLNFGGFLFYHHFGGILDFRFQWFFGFSTCS